MAAWSRAGHDDALLSERADHPAARAAGFDAGLTGQPTVVTPASEPLLLGRLSPSHTSLGELAFDVAWALFRARDQR